MVYVFVPHAEVYLCLLNNNFTVKQIAQRLHRSQTIIRKNLAALEKCGIVSATGYPAVYSIRDNCDCKELKEIFELLPLARVGIFARIGYPCFLDQEASDSCNAQGRLTHRYNRETGKIEPMD